MNTIHKTLLGITTGVGLTIGLMSGTAHAFFCPIVTDAVRTAYFTTQGAMRIASAVAEYQIADSKKKELKIWEKRKQFKNKDDKDGEEDGDDTESENVGDEGGEGGEEGSDGDSSGSKSALPKGVYYEYMKNATATGSEEYIPAQSSASEQEKYVREHLFYDSDESKLTEEAKQKVINTRLAYVEALAKEVLSLSAGARESIASELSILSKAKTTAGGVIQQVDLLAQTKKVMIEQKAADILLQAKLLELDAAQMILGLNPQRIENPDESKGGNNE